MRAPSLSLEVLLASLSGGETKTPTLRPEAVAVPSPYPGARASSVVWLRRDLRLVDNPAIADALSFDGPCAVAFVLDENILDGLSPSDRRVSFICGCLDEIRGALRAAGSDLFLLCGDPVREIPLLASLLGAKRVCAGKDFEPYALTRDAAVSAELAKIGAHLRLLDENQAIPTKLVLEGSSLPGTFAAFRRKWEKAVERGAPSLPESSGVLRRVLPCLPSREGRVSPEAFGFETFSDWDRIGLFPGESAGSALLEAFLYRLGGYERAREGLRSDAGSGLSVHLRHGAISASRCIERAASAGSGASSWLSEFCWRDWFFALAEATPDLLSGKSFVAGLSEVKWPGNPEHAQAWRAGLTGYPLIDAGMRELTQTGRLSNRLRMICASFFCKQLLLDWRDGEAWFAETLLDYDATANVGNWQWSAGVGCDAAPFFRIFNPVSQARERDPDGRYVRKWLPELERLPNDFIFEPWTAPDSFALAKVYPPPIVDLADARRRALLFAEETLSPAAKKTFSP